MNIKVPLKWLDMARKHNGIIAGGCLRDLVLGGQPPKDIDIFLMYQTLTEAFQASEEYADGFRVLKTIEDGESYDLIEHRFTKAEEIMEYFDLGICKLYCDPADGEIRFHEDFLADVQNKTITIVRPGNVGHADHLVRVCNRYPDYRVISLEQPAIWDFEEVE